MSKKWVLVNAISMFRMRYLIEVEEGGEPIWALDSVTCNEAKEFSQKHLDEVIVDWKEVTTEEALEQYRSDEPEFGEAWDDELIMKNAFTTVEDLKEISPTLFSQKPLDFSD